jgi:hypothetical protein
VTAVYRVDWMPGTDRLRGTCHCGATGEAEDPAVIWQWLLAHPAHLAHPVRRETGRRETGSASGTP